MTYVLTPALCWCQYFYQTYPEEKSATFYSIIDHNNSVFMSTGKICESWECSEVTRFDYFGNQIWNSEFTNTDVGSATLLLLNDTLYVGGNYNPGQAKSVINRMTLDGSAIDEHIYTDPLNRFERSLVNQLYSDNKVLYFSGGSYKNDGGKGLIYSINKSMDLNICFVDTIQDNSTVKDVHIGPDSLLTCFIMENGIVAPRERRRIEKYDEDLNLVWKYQPPDSLLFLGNDIHLYGTVLNNGNIFFSYYKFGWNDRLPNLRCIDTVSKQAKWEYDFPNINSYKRQVLKTKELKNGDILISGQYATLASNPRIKNSPWLMRIDRNGNRKWERAFVELAPDGQDKTGALWDAIELDNGDIMACGFVINNNKQVPLLIRTDAEGCIHQAQANCPTVQIIDLMSEAVDEIGEAVMSVRPNPASTYITINAPSNSAYTIFSSSGKPIIKGIAEDGFEIDISQLTTGFYAVKVIDNTGQIYYQKLQKL
jgi:hypothetical protein